MNTPRMLRPLVAVVVAALMATTLAVTAATTPAGAEPAGAPAAASVTGAQLVDACTLVPDSIPGVFDFTPACLVHDECYGARSTSRLACDVRFLDLMKASCDDARVTLERNRDRCLNLAGIYFYGVRLFGGFFWNDVN